MEEIRIKDLLEFYVSKIKVIALIVIITILLGSVYSLFFLKPKYEATTTLVLTGQAVPINSSAVSEETGAITQNDLNLNSKLVATYREIIKSKTVLKELIDELNLDYNVDDLKKQISVSTIADTEMISITVTNYKAEEAASIANELAVIFSEHIKGIYKIENISIIDRAEIQTIPINVNIAKQLVIYFLIGMFIGLIIVFILFYSDITLKDESQVEKIGFSILTSIPEKKEKGGKNE